MWNRKPFQDQFSQYFSIPLPHKKYKKRQIALISVIRFFYTSPELKCKKKFWLKHALYQRHYKTNIFSPSDLYSVWGSKEAVPVSLVSRCILTHWGKPPLPSSHSPCWQHLCQVRRLKVMTGKTSLASRHIFHWELCLLTFCCCCYFGNTFLWRYILKFDHTLLDSPRILELFEDDGSD